MFDRIREHFFSFTGLFVSVCHASLVVGLVNVAKCLLRVWQSFFADPF